MQNYFFRLATVYFNPELKSLSSVAFWFFASFLKIKIRSWVRVLGEYKIKDLMSSTYRSCTRLSYVNMLNCQKQDLLLTLCKILKLFLRLKLQNRVHRYKRTPSCVAWDHCKEETARHSVDTNIFGFQSQSRL